jgi:hypothetical protein
LAEGRIETVPGRVSPPKAIFVKGFSGGLAEGERFHVQAYADGTYTYEDSSGTSRTVEKLVFTKLIQRLD